MVQSHATLAAKYLMIDMVGSFLYFPVWWYTKGLVGAGAASVRLVRDAGRSLGIGVWAKNLFTPMYGYYDAMSRIISFCIRSIAVFFYAFLMLFVIAFALALFAAWIALPAVVAYGIFFQFEAFPYSVRL
jgi:hypothetical protein